uniref:Pectinesterase n=1 Tax=Heterorhabditis bacteriophora TaxID=37862 RepID=A0A1I7WZN2_HETBA
MKGINWDMKLGSKIGSVRIAGQSFWPSQQISQDISFYALRVCSELAYKFTFRIINTAKTVMAYCCCTSRALMYSALSAFGKIAYVYISNVNSITDPENPVNAHFCMP